jgi:hypothetical protein
VNCGDALAPLLEAELAELRGEGTSQLAAHVRACPRCRGRAERILAGQAGLDRALARRSGYGATVPRRRPAWRALGPLAPLALAAGIAAVALLRPRPDLTRAPSGPVVPRPDVLVAGARAVAVFQTHNPDIVVIWSF